MWRPSHRHLVANTMMAGRMRPLRSCARATTLFASPPSASSRNRSGSLARKGPFGVRCSSERVVRAYQHHCAVCRLKRDELLEAAHIVPDADPLGAPVVPNGVALCKLHHAAFDRYLIGIRPDCVVEVRRDVLDDTDGPMLIHGLQGFHGTSLLLPRVRALRPDPVLLEARYERFRQAG